MSFSLGSTVSCTERAWVARKMNGKWYLPVRGNYEHPSTNGGEHSPLTITKFLGTIETHKLEHIVEPREAWNKSIVICRDYSSTGVIIGLERKLIGRSVGNGGPDMSGDYDGGYLETHGHFDLYVVKSELRGIPFYVPLSGIWVNGK
jgi:hypothetical protein